MPLLPSLRWGGHRWWLPATAASSAALANWMLRFAERPPAGNCGSLAELCGDYLRRDSGLLIWTSLSWVADDRSRIGAAVSLEALSHWLDQHLVERLMAADGVQAPRVDGAVRARWARLAQADCTAPLAARLHRAAAWLETLGPAVPVAWQSGWPQLIEPADALSAELPNPTEADCPAALYPDPAIDLPAVARTSLRCRSLAERFETRLQSEKAAALKQLAYGLSHEINNPLANISARAQQLQREEKHPDRRRALEQIDHQAMRAFEMIADLMFVAQPSPPQPIRFSLSELLVEVVAAHLPRVRSRSIEIRPPCSASASPEVFADRDQIHDCCDAMLRNAVDAVGRDGRIDVLIGIEGSEAIVGIADDGPGLSAQDRRHAFDPYYSGREAGRGLGMGLAKARVLADQNGGSLTLATSPPGCVAYLRVPRS